MDDGSVVLVQTREADEEDWVKAFGFRWEIRVSMEGLQSVFLGEGGVATLRVHFASNCVFEVLVLVVVVRVLDTIIGYLDHQGNLKP